LISGSALNLLAMTILIRVDGLLGVALAMVAGATLAHGILIPSALQSEVKFRVRRAFFAAIGRPLAVAVVLSASFYAIRLTGAARSWGMLVVHGAIAGTVAIVAILTIGVSAAERRQYVVTPLRRMLGYPASA
jgi:hypothetical protein